MDGKHEETVLGRNARWLVFLMQQILLAVYNGEPISIELAEMTMRVVECVRQGIINSGV